MVFIPKARAACAGFCIPEAPEGKHTGHTGPEHHALRAGFRTKKCPAGGKAGHWGEARKQGAQGGAAPKPAASANADGTGFPHAPGSNSGSYVPCRSGYPFCLESLYTFCGTNLYRSGVLICISSGYRRLPKRVGVCRGYDALPGPVDGVAARGTGNNRPHGRENTR